MLKIFITDINLFTDEDIKSLLPHISEERRLFALRLKNRNRLYECVAGEALARYALSVCGPAKVLPGDYVILREEGGKPCQTTVPGLFFNISHSKGLCLCAVSDSAVGADIERIGRMKLKNPAFFLTEAELEAYEKAGDKERFLTSVWCRKESFLKYTGKGFNRKPSAIDTFALENEEGVGFIEGDTETGFWYSICQKKINLGIDKRDQITQSHKTLNFIKTQDIVVAFKNP